MKKLILSLCFMVFVAGCGGVEWFPDTRSSAASTAETVTASAGGPYTQVGASTIILTGSGSSSKGSAVTYVWSITSSNSATATLDSATTASTSFSATAEGTYNVQLKVTSATDTTKSALSNTTVTVTPPAETVTAYAGGARTLNGPGNTITLTGSGTSSKKTGVTFLWSLTSKPSGAIATLDSSTTATTSTTTTTASFSANTVGEYTVELKVTSDSDATVFKADTATITVTAPATIETVTASAGDDRTEDGAGSVNAITLNGSVNFAIGPVTTAWTVTSANSASAHFGTPAAAVTTFYADVAGTYTVQLTATSTADPSKTITDSAIITVTDDTALGLKGSYFPLTPLVRSGVTRSWTYTVTSGATVETVTVQGTNTLSHTLRIDPVTVSQVLFSLPPTGGLFLKSVASNLTVSTYTPGLPIIPVNTAVGSAPEATTYTVSIGSSSNTHTATLTVVGLEETRTVPAGTFHNVLHIKSTNDSTVEENPAADSWYAPGVGLIEDSKKKLTAFTE